MAIGPMAHSLRVSALSSLPLLTLSASSLSSISLLTLSASSLSSLPPLTLSALSSLPLLTLSALSSPAAHSLRPHPCSSPRLHPCSSLPSLSPPAPPRTANAEYADWESWINPPTLRIACYLCRTGYNALLRGLWVEDRALEAYRVFTRMLDTGIAKKGKWGMPWMFFWRIYGGQGL
ncbi:hypothetical protein Syun_008480 [Stephania yunnanensis]|uniref:Pentatricopeptide repeat-containing protein n=1 Tax=Stephania yunnanensis TaxID=152371 RepID=A0AAP0KCM9_9MAGN